MTTTPPVCASCGQPASTALAGAEHDSTVPGRAETGRAAGETRWAWECRNEACPEFGQPIDPNEPPPRDPPSPEGPR